MSKKILQVIPILMLLELGVPTSMAQAQVTLTHDGNYYNVSQFGVLLQDGTLFRSKSTDCGKAHSITLKQEKSSNSPKTRLAAVRTLGGCVDSIRAELIANASSADELLTINSTLEPFETRLKNQEESTSAENSFLGIKLGVGVGVSFSEDDVVSEAEIGADNVIVATKTESQLARVIFESHFYGLCKTKACNAGRFGIGPYFAIVAKSEKLISAFSTGVMFGWKDSKPGSSGGFSIGIGAVLDNDVKSLADGFVVGEPLPAGETQIRFEEKSRWSAMLFFTRTF